LLTLDGHLKLTDFGLAGSMVTRKRTPNQRFPSPHHSSSRRLDPGLIAEMSRARPDEPTATTEDVLASESSDGEELTSEGKCKCQNEDWKRNLKWVRRRTVCGTAGYRPPEQVQERFLDYFSRNGYDERADWFSLGVCCYTMLIGRRPFPTRKELLQSDSQRQMIIPQRALPTTVNNEILEKVMNDTEYQCLMFEVQYPSCFSDETDAKDFVDRLLARDPEVRPRYDGIIKHPWMEPEIFEEESVLRRAIPDWVKDHAHLQSRNVNIPKPIARRAGQGIKYDATLSECIDKLCSECFDNNDKIYAGNFATKWTTKAQESNLALFRHWNYMSDEAIKLEISAAKKGKRNSI
jgi:serine/threonine protein kinase